jgi:PAS domain-containing protein
MATLDSLARHTLDTLPLNVAVTDDEGTILLTNRAWDEFAGVGPEGDDMVG